MLVPIEAPESGVAVSKSSGSWSAIGTGWEDVEGLAVSLKTTGRPVQINLVPDVETAIEGADGTTMKACLNARQGFFRVLRGDVELGTCCLVNGGRATISVPPQLCLFDQPPGGLHRYRLQARGAGVSVVGCKLVAYEI